MPLPSGYTYVTCSGGRKYGLAYDAGADKFGGGCNESTPHCAVQNAACTAFSTQTCPPGAVQVLCPDDNGTILAVRRSSDGAEGFRCETCGLTEQHPLGDVLLNANRSHWD